jgi:DNA helicase-4
MSTYEGKIGTFDYRGVIRDVKLAYVLQDEWNTIVELVDVESNVSLGNFNLKTIIRNGMLKMQNGKASTNDKFDKVKPLRDFFMSRIKINNEPFKLDDEQLWAINSTKNSLVTARAGSGKTRTIVGKIIDLIENKGCTPGNLMAFCFNNNASAEINTRLNEMVLVDNIKKYKDTKIATTFHAFAKTRVLGYDKPIETERKPMFKKILNMLRTDNSELSADIYSFFRNETLRIDRKNFQSEATYYEFIRNSKYTTLNGENVKSFAEKIIADYLFERGIKYEYEKAFYPRRLATSDKKLVELVKDVKETKPDFFLPEYGLLWEHWAVDGAEDSRRRADFEGCVGNYNEYLLKKKWKQAFWKSDLSSMLDGKNYYNIEVLKVKRFLETENNEFNKLGTREAKEEYLGKLLAKSGVEKKKLSPDVLHKIVWEKTIDGFTLLIDQFINKLQLNFYKNPNAFYDIIKKESDERIRKFYEIGMMVYEKYKHNMDFNRLVYEAILHIQKGNANEIIASLKYILIDEYQDFSALFNELIATMLAKNPSIKLFCVGDDWQAINRFAGSDLKYFHQFKQMPNAELHNITKNYRSASLIVQHANNFARRFGFGGSVMSVFNEDVVGSIIELDVSREYVDVNNENRFTKHLEKENNYILKLQYLKACTEFLEKHKHEDTVILCRANTFLYNDLSWLYNLLQKTCSGFMSVEEFKKRVTIKTVHKSKGEEYTNVILLGMNEGSFPIYNPNNILFKAFNETADDAIQDERRLFYVAVTRAKKNLLLLYEKEKVSSFIMSKSINLHSVEPPF